MSREEKLMIKVLRGTQDANITFSELQRLRSSLGFQFRVKGDHFIYWREDVNEVINIQPNGNKAKPYQVKQIREIIIKYQLGGGKDE